MAPRRRTLKEYALPPTSPPPWSGSAAVNSLAGKGAADLAQDSADRHPELRVPQQRIDSVIQPRPTEASSREPTDLVG